MKSPPGFAAARPVVGALLSAGVVLCAGLPLIDHAGPLQAVALVVVALSQAAAVWQGMRRRRAAPARQPPETVATEDADTRRLLAGVLPVWLFHIGSARRQTDDAVSSLAGSFSSIARQFEAAGFRGAGGASEPVASFDLLTLCERELRPVITSMTRILDGKKALVQSVEQLALATRELRDMASEVTHIAMHTNILAINAAIEAARAGESGRGFGVIGKSIRQLSTTSAEAGKRIAERMAQVDQLMNDTVRAAAEASEHDRAAIGLSGSVIQDVLSHVRHLGDDAERMRQRGNTICADIEQLIVGLQFQDRVNQIIGAVDADMDRLKQAVEADTPALPPAEVWLAELDARYTMDDQRRGASHSPAAAPASDAETVFF